MTRHGKNCTASAVYSYHEKKKDTKSSGYGSQSDRLSKDSVKDFDCCGLTLQPCREPVITSEGFLYDKEAILEYIVHQKQEYSRKLREYEKQKKKSTEREREEVQSVKKKDVEKFLTAESVILTKKSSAFSKSQEKGSGSTSGASGDKKANDQGNKLPSFWIPSLTPQAAKEETKKPDSKVYCPMSGKPLKLKELYPVKFTPVVNDDSKPTIAKDARYMCPVTHDLLGNSVPCAVLKPTGDVVTMECVENIIKKDWLCPLTGKPLKETDIIEMNRGGTGFSGSGNELKAKSFRPSMQTS
ncbi:nitric oxide synthase-interacting protein-like [Rhopilema esculentum]|uniref:nitric oxide synthase-interacting protein-like n=1 Tax=Rhopilema esculentum TaxID=499914 RepID=UPI0031D21A6A|eukprot:gene9443-17161_t